MNSLNKIPDGMVGIEIPKQDYAVFTFKGDGAHLQLPEGNALVYNIIFNKLLPSYNLRHRPKNYNIQMISPSLAPENASRTIMIPVNAD